MGVFEVLKEIFCKEEKQMLINELKSLFTSEKALNSVSVVLSGISQIVAFIEQNADAGKRNDAIDAVVKLLQAEKK